MKPASPLSAVALLLIIASAGVPGGRNPAGAPAPATRMVTVCKQTSPAGGTNFQFTRSNTFGPLPSFTLNGGQCVTYDLTGQDAANTFTESVPAGWTLTNISCNNTTTPVKFTGANSNPAFEPGDNTVSLDVIEPNVTCVFTNTRPCVQPPAGMVSWWPGDANSTDIVGGWGGFPYGPTSYYVPGKVGPSFYFGGNNFFETVDAPAHIPAASFTIDAWVKTQSTISKGHTTVVSRYECGGACPPGANSLYTLELVYGVATAVVRDTDATAPFTQGLTVTGPYVADAQWHHLAMVRDLTFTNRLILYVDGAPVAASPLNAGSDSTLKEEDKKPDPLTIGAKKKSGGAYQGSGVPNMQDFFRGEIDEVEYFNRALADGEVALIYNAGANGKCK